MSNARGGLRAFLWASQCLWRSLTDSWTVTVKAGCFEKYSEEGREGTHQAVKLGSSGRSRTDTGFTPPDFESGVSTNFTTLP